MFSDQVAVRRCAFILLSVLLACTAGMLFAIVITSGGMSWLHFPQIFLLFLCCLWLAWGFGTAIAGILWSPGPKPPAVPSWRGTGRTAVLVPVYNEDATAVLSRVAAMIEGLRALGRLDGFDFHVLSDSTRPECAAEERRAALKVLAMLDAGRHLYYRHRSDNIGRKAGNIADFVKTNGGAYEFMLILDADSLMRPETICEMTDRIAADPELGLLQSQPLIIGRRTLFGRALQFSAALFSPIFSRGIACLQGREGPFWGHNAIVRTRAFAACCGLPKFGGAAPFGGHILSHDTIEAALLARAGYKVRVDPDLGGSFEEAPSNLIEYAKRDRRWCQGNLQHARILAAPRLRLWSRISILCGIMAYVASPIWLFFLILSLLDPILAPVPDYFPANSIFPVFPQPETGKALLLFFGIVLLLLLPKTMIAFATAFWGERRSFGGTGRILAGATCELLLTSVLAPVLMMFQSKAVFEILVGADSGWPATDREDGSVPLKAAFRASWWMMAVGGAALFVAYWYTTGLLLWVCPIALPLLLSPFLISWTGDPALGDRARAAGLFATPFELDPEPVIRAARSWKERLSGAAKPAGATDDAARPGSDLTIEGATA